MTNPENQLESPSAVKAPASGLQSAHFQASGAEMKKISSSDHTMPVVMPSHDHLLAQLGMACSTRTPAVMADVDRSTAEATKLFPGKDPATQDLRNSAYRYIMNAEKVDDYSMGAAADIARLMLNNPDTINTLNSYVRDQFAQGLVPANDLSQVEAKYPPQPWTGKIVF
jgi:hypothetical protein